MVGIFVWREVNTVPLGQNLLAYCRICTSKEIGNHVNVRFFYVTCHDKICQLVGLGILDFSQTMVQKRENSVE